MKLQLPSGEGGSRRSVAERGCVRKDQPQRFGMSAALEFPGLTRAHALRLVPWTQPRSGGLPESAAFSLLECMVAIAIFFAAAFAILELVSGALANARMLQRPQVDAAAVASSFSVTNKIIEGTESGDLSDLLGDTYRGYTWEYTSREIASNKLFQVDFVIFSPAAGHPVFSQISARFFRPQSPAGSMDGGLGFH